MSKVAKVLKGALGSAIVDNRTFLMTVRAVFDLTAEELGLMLDEPRNRQTVYGWCAKAGYELPENSRDEIEAFIVKNCSLNDPTESIRKAIDRRK